MKVLLFFDIGGSMDAHIKLCEELFSAAKTEFKHMDFFYFHNCLYESVWKDNRRRHNEKLNTWDVLHKYPHDYKIIFVGDATMSPYEVTYPGGSVEHWNEEAGRRLARPRDADVTSTAVWLNPVAREALGLHAVDRPDLPDHERPHVSPDAAGPRQRDARVEPVSRQPEFIARVWRTLHAVVFGLAPLVDRIFHWRAQSLLRIFVSHFLYSLLSALSLFSVMNKASQLDTSAPSHDFVPYQLFLKLSQGGAGHSSVTPEPPGILTLLLGAVVYSCLATIFEVRNSDGAAAGKLSEILRKVTGDLDRRVAARTFVLTISWFRKARGASQISLAILLIAVLECLKMQDYVSLGALLGLTIVIWINLSATAYRVSKGYFGTTGPEVLELIDFIHANRDLDGGEGGRWAGVGLSTDAIDAVAGEKFSGRPKPIDGVV